MRLPFRTLRQKVLAVVLVTTLAALVVALGSTMTYHLRTQRQALITDITTQAELIGHMTAPALSFDDQTLARQNLALLRHRPIVRAAAIYDARGAMFASYAAPEQTGAPATVAGRDVITIDGQELTLTRRIVVEGDLLGTVFLRAKYDILGAFFGYLGIASASLAFALLAAYMLLNRLHPIVTGPILAIAEIAREVVEQRDYSRRAEKKSNDEVGVLVDSFNNMLAEIEQRTGELESSNNETVREVAERRRAQQEVMQLNEKLEQRVRDRTLELQTANVQLETANDELSTAKAVAENANQAKSAFLSGMSHELRTPLNAILGFAQLLGTESLPTTPAQRREFVDYILKAGRHLLVLINEILDLSKIESGAMSISMEPVALAEVLHECRDMMEPLAAKRSIRLEFADAGGRHVWADRTRIKQILLNLLSNAVKYNRDGGAVKVSVIEAGPNVRVCVRDTGFGLRQDQLEQLFQPFNRLGQEAGGEDGTGIGLVVTRRLAELMGGEVGVSSEAGVGSEFWIDLKPSVAAQASCSPGAAQQLMAGRPDGSAKRSILYVEDNPANLRLVEEIVSFRDDIELMSASDARTGIEFAHAHQPDMILMDINLPGMGGDEALQRLRADPATAHIPVVALTANAMPRDVARGIENGFHQYLTKPIDIDHFLEALDSALGPVVKHKPPAEAEKDN